MPNNVALELYYDGSWHNLTADGDVLAGQPIVVMRGDTAESAAPRPGTLSARLDNTDDTYRTSNPLSPLYGLAGRNTPARVSVDGNVRCAVEASSWTAGQTRDFRRSPKRGSAWVDFEGGGLLQRVNNWTEPLRSTLFEANNALTTTVGYWSMEENRGAQQLTAVTPGSVSRGLRGASFDGQSYPAGSGPVLDFSGSQTGFASGTFAPHTSAGNAGWQVSWVQLHNTIDAAGSWSTILQLRPSDGGYVLVQRGEGNKALLKVYTSTLFADPPLLDISANLPSISSDIWAAYVLRATRSGSTITMRLYRALAGETGFTEVLSGTYSGALAQLDQWQTGTGNGNLPVSVGHLIGVVGQTEDLTDGGRMTAFNGFAGERTAYQFARLCGLKGLPYFIRGDPNASAIMGPQTVMTLADQFREIRDTEDGLIFDEKGGLYLIFTVLNARYNGTPATLAATDLTVLPPEVTDNLGVHNLVTVSNSAGGEATAEDTTSALSTQPPPAGINEERQDVKVNILDPGDLPQQANWWLRRGTVDLPRYPKVTVNMAVLSPSKRAEIDDVDVGDVLEITGYRENTIRLFVIGYTETIPNVGARTIVFTCAPDQQFHVRTYDEARYDLRTATIKVAAIASATQLILKTTDDEEWSNTSTYDVMIAGERITFVAGQMGARTGTPGNYQQIVQNVLRARNGISKPLPLGAPIHVVEQGRYAK